MSSFFKAYRYGNILSLDTALGAVASAMFFAKLISANVWIYGKIALGLTVWIIYTADHLMDAWKVKGNASSERHRFHQKHFKVLLMLMVAAIVIDLIVVSYMRRSLLGYGALLSVVVVMYLIISHYLKMLKEIFIALIYTLGVMLPALADRAHLLEQSDLVAMMNFCMVAVANLFVFSWFDVDRDRADGHPSFVTFYGKEKTKMIIYGLSVAHAATSIWLIAFWSYPVLPLAILSLMMLILLVILFFDKYFSNNDRFRLVGDAIFFLPLIYVLA